MANSKTSFTQAETHARVRGMMFDYVDRVAQRLGYIRVEQGSELAARVRDAMDSESASAVLEHVQLSIARHPERLSGARTDSELMRVLYEFFVEALAKIEKDADEALIYQRAAADELDPDPAFRYGALEAAAKDWP